jgi:enoyl-CoA hydratase/carnithine racemase
MFAAMPMSKTPREPGARFQRRGAIGEIILDRPPLNLLDLEAFDELRAAFAQAQQPAVRAVVLRAEGRAFSAGVDVRMFQDTSELAARRVARSVIHMIHDLEQLPVPTVACVHGLCLTVGFEMALACDLVIASDTATFGLIEADVGITPLGGGTQRLATRAGTARALQMVLLAERMPAEELQRWNIVNRLVAETDLLASGRELAEKLAAGPTAAHAATKDVVRATSAAGIQAADQLLPTLAIRLFATQDLAAGIEAVLRKQPGKAIFRGQ